ncbi:hypothetical protein NDU88_002757 [Pleurodeles waltl]|uniref:Uncharacterized protein n=1 Tax=Pleurodeles waltl TaxID=8319 RepID=A0AAV7TLL5_PLEWA|nr:hypothetical protein NDU88_002757 [Pleurodeles waltl]
MSTETCAEVLNVLPEIPVILRNTETQSPVRQTNEPPSIKRMGACSLSNQRINRQPRGRDATGATPNVALVRIMNGRSPKKYFGSLSYCKGNAMVTTQLTNKQHLRPITFRRRLQGYRMASNSNAVNEYCNEQWERQNPYAQANTSV